VPFAEIRLGAEHPYLISGIIPRVGLTVVWGEWKCGKSFIVFDLAMHVALGNEYRGRRVHCWPVVYCAFEGQTGISARVEAFRQRFLAEAVDEAEVPFFLQPLRLKLVTDHQHLIAAITEQLGEISPVLVVLDTLNRSMHGSESSDADMGAYIHAADAIREAFECAVVVVHHCGHDGNRPRGHSSLLGAADAVIAVKKETAGQIIVEIEDMKDGKSGDHFASRLEIVEVGKVGAKEDGEPITSCVVIPVDDAAVQPKRPKQRSLPPAASLALDALGEAVAEHGMVPRELGGRIPANVLTVSLSLWRRYAYHRDPESDQGARKRAFQRARQTLQDRGRVGVWGPEDGREETTHCWLVNQRLAGHSGHAGTFSGACPGTERDTPL
jgi:hypothetical protein